MKTALIVAFTIALLGVSTALASDKTKAKDAKAEKPKVAKSSSSDQKGGILLTGSYTKQKIRRHGRITDGASQVQVIDHDAIERSGASDVKQLLVHQGIH